MWKAENASTKNHSSTAVTEPLPPSTPAHSTSDNANSASDTATIARSTWRGRVSARHRTAPAAARSSMATTLAAASIVLAPQRGQPVDIHRAELAVDVEDRDPHDKDADKGIEQHA